MSKNRKYEYRVLQDDNGWSAGIVRQASRHRTVVSKSQDGFSSEAEATAWAEAELKTFGQAQSERNKRRDIRREEQRDLAAARAEKQLAEAQARFDDED